MIKALLYVAQTIGALLLLIQLIPQATESGGDPAGNGMSAGFRGILFVFTLSLQGLLIAGSLMVYLQARKSGLLEITAAFILISFGIYLGVKAWNEYGGDGPVNSTFQIGLTGSALLMVGLGPYLLWRSSPTSGLVLRNFWITVSAVAGFLGLIYFIQSHYSAKSRALRVLRSTGFKALASTDGEYLVEGLGTSFHCLS